MLKGIVAQSALGVTLGLGLYWGISRWLETRLFGLRALDPITIAAAVMTLPAIALVAALVPGRMRHVGRNAADQLDMAKEHGLPTLLDSREVAELLRTTRKAVYAMLERGQIPGVPRLGRRVLFHRETLVEWLRQKSAPSLER